MNILLVQMAFLGDVILTTPLISGIKELYPNSKVWFLTTPAASGLLSSDPKLEGVITYQKRSKDKGLLGTLRFAKELNQYKFDLIISVHKSYRTSLLISLLKAPKKIGFKQAKFRWAYTDLIEMTEGHAVQRFFSILKFHPNFSKISPRLNLVFPDVLDKLKEKFGIAQRYAVIAPGSVWATKRWASNNYRTLGQELLERGFQVIALGNNEEVNLAQQALPDGGVNLAGKLSLSESFAILKSAQVLFCNDSMILHAASALKVPTVAIFCATSPSFGFGPWENNAVVVEKDNLSCKPCSRHGAKKCPLNTNACMNDLEPVKVLKAFDSLKI